MSRRLVPHFSLLNISPSASASEISAAFRAAALRSHPDVGGCAAHFAELQAARDACLASTRGRELSSLRMHDYRGSDHRAGDKWQLLASIVLPTAVGMAIGVRMIMSDSGGGEGVRAGGNSQVRVERRRRDVDLVGKEGRRPRKEDV